MLEQFQKELEFCSSCPKLCQSQCPVGTVKGSTTVSPWGLMQTFNQIRKGEMELDEETSKLSYQCTTCKACTEYCDHHIDVPRVVNYVRKKAVEQELAPKEINGFLAKFHRYNNPFSKDLLTKFKALIPPQYFEMNSSTVYFPSCTTISKSPEVISDTFSLFEKLKINFVSAYPETIQCCGFPLLSAGMVDEFVDLAEVNFHELRNYKTIISGSPSCVYTLKEMYKKYDFNLGDRVVTINHFIEPYLHNVNYRIKKNIRSKVMYHDPCYLSRYLKEVELPRELIGHVSGYSPHEFFNHGANSGCSGQGGCYSVVDKENSDEIAKVRIKEVEEKNINTLVTQCPSCVHKFRKNSHRLVVKDIMSYINDCIEGVKEE